MDFMEPITCFFQFALEEATFDPERSDHPVSGCMGERKQPKQSCSVWSSAGSIILFSFCFPTSLTIFISHFIFKLTYCRLIVQTNSFGGESIVYKENTKHVLHNIIHSVQDTVLYTLH